MAFQLLSISFSFIRHVQLVSFPYSSLKSYSFWLEKKRCEMKTREQGLRSGVIEDFILLQFVPQRWASKRSGPISFFLNHNMVNHKTILLLLLLAPVYLILLPRIIRWLNFGNISYILTGVNDIKLTGSLKIPSLGIWGLVEVFTRFDPSLTLLAQKRGYVSYRLRVGYVFH